MLQNAADAQVADANGAQSALWAEINRQLTKIRVRRNLRVVRLSDSTNEQQAIISLIGWYFCWLQILACYLDENGTSCDNYNQNWILYSENV